MYLRQADNEVAFHATILAFLQEHGAVYWGDTERGHLQVLETWKGFLYPRDSRRESSRYGSHSLKLLIGPVLIKIQTDRSTRRIVQLQG